MSDRGARRPYVTAAILVYAARYALGRKTGAPHDVENAIAANLELFERDHGCRQALIEDIERAIPHQGALGAQMDREAWMRTLGRLKSAGGTTMNAKRSSPESVSLSGVAGVDPARQP